MSARVLTNEFAKMRHLRIWLLMAVLLVAVTGTGLYAGVATPSFDRATESTWNSLLAGLNWGFTLVSPLLIAVVASRLVDAEHQGGGWLLSETSGITPGSLSRAKLLALGILVTTVTLLVSAVLAAIGFAAGVGALWPVGRWLGLTACMVLVNLVVLALHVILSARVENQLVGIGIGLLGTVLALFGTAVPAWIAHLTPWGYYALSTAADYAGHDLVARTPGYLSVAGLALVTALVFILFTRSFDRQEA